MDSRSSTSGFVSKNNSVDSDDITTSSISTLSSFKDFIENHVHPTRKEYNAFATSYLCSEVPFNNIICEDSNSYKDLDLKFPQLVPIETYHIQQNARQLLGPSIRRQYIIPSSQWILNDLLCKKFPKNESRERILYLYAKARQWCEVDKALSMDRQYPKPNPQTIRKLYSVEHQKATKLARRKTGMSRKEPISTPVSVMNISEQMMCDILDLLEVHISYDPGQELNEEQRGKWAVWEENVKKVFEDIEPLHELQAQETHWQQKAVESVKIKGKPKTKRFWKRNTYPPKTLEDYIVEKRKLLPAIKPEHLQTDYLSGIWVPELMTDKFEITPQNYDSRLVEAEGPDPISWWVVHEATQKCWQWLHQIPPNL